MTPSGSEEQINAQRAALEANPADEGAFVTLGSIYTQYERWDDLIGLYESRARQGADGEAGALLAKAGELALRRLHNSTLAEDLFRQALHADARCVLALESLIEIHEERGDHLALADALERQAGQTSDPHQSAHLYFRAGKVFEERLLRRDRAALFFTRAARMDPDLDAARDAALRCHLALHRWQQAKKTLDSARDRGAETKALAEQYARLAAVLIDEPLDHALATEAALESLRIDRDRADATVILEKLRAAPDGWRADAKSLLEQAEAAKERRTSARLCLHAAGLHAAFDPEGSQTVISLAERALLLAPTVARPLDLLERYLGGRGEWRALIEALRRLAAKIRDRSALAELHLRIARLELVHLGDPSRAVESLERVLSLDPANEPAAQQAFELHVESGRRAEALGVLERHLAAAPERPQHGPWRLRAAEIAQSLGDPARARSHLEAARRADRRSPRIAAALAPMLAESGEWRAYSEAVEAQSQSEQDPVRRARFLEELARVDLEKLGSPRDALRRLAIALQLDPGRHALRKAIDAAAVQADLFVELARAYRAAADSPTADARARKVLLRRTAEVWDRDLARPDKAIEAWRDLVAADPQDPGARAALDACMVRAGRLEELVADLTQRIERARDLGERRDLWAKLAACHEEAGDQEMAAKAWREVSAAGESEQLVPALRGLDRALDSMGIAGAAERLEVLARLAEHSSGSERADIELARAGVFQALGRPSEAAQILIATVRGGGLPAGRVAEGIGILEQLLARGVDPLPIAQTLAPWYATQREPAKQAAMLELIAARMPLEGDPRERARLLLDAAVIHEEKLADPRGALSAASGALRACPSHAEARQICERLARAVGAIAELHQLLVEAADRLTDSPDEERSVRARAAQIAEEELGDAETAAGQLRRCLELAPGDGPTLAALTRVALVAEHWQEACDVLVQRVAQAAGAERLALLTQLAETLQERVGDPAAAAKAYRQALEIAPPEARPRLLSKLATACEEMEDHEGQGQALDELSRTSSDPVEAADAARRRALLQVHRLGVPMDAIEHFRTALTERPTDTEARAELESLVSTAEPAVALAASEALLAVAEASGDLRKVLAALEPIAAQTSDRAGRAAVERRAARIWGEQLGQWSMAFVALERAVRLVPGDEATRRELREAAARAGVEAEAARLYEEFLPSLTGGEAGAAWRELAKLSEEKLGDAERATRAWTEALRMVAGDRQALAALARLHRGSGRARERVDACLELADRTDSTEERLACLREAAEALETSLDDPGRAAEVWAQVVSERPDDADADVALERLLTRLDRPVDLAALLERRRSRLGGEGDHAMAIRLAELRFGPLGQPAEALGLVGAVLRSNPTHPRARALLEDLAAVTGPIGREALAVADVLLRSLGEHGARVLVRQRRLAGVEDPTERARLYAEVRAIQEGDLGRPEDAFATVVSAYLEGGGAATDAEAELERLAGVTALWEKLASAFETRASTAGGDSALELRRRAARIRTERVSDPQGAIAAWRRVSEEAPNDLEALQELEKLYSRVEQTAQLVEVAHRRASLAVGPERASLLVNVAQLLFSMGEEQRGLDVAQEALASDPDCLGALALLAEAHRRAGRTEDLAYVLQVEADLARTDEGRRRELLIERASALEAVRDGRLALDGYALLLAEDRQDQAVLDGLERLLANPATRDGSARLLEDVYRAQGNGARLARLLTMRAEAAVPEERAALLGEITSLYERLGDHGKAFAARTRTFLEVLPAGTDDPALRSDLERLAALANDYPGLARAYERALERGLPLAARAEVLRRLATLYGDRLEDPEAAARALEALADLGADTEALRDLARLHRARGAWRELLGVLRQQSELAPSSEEKKDLLFEAAAVAEERLVDREGAMEAYRQILEVDPEDPNALRLLGKLLGSAERWDELVEVLDREIKVAEDQPGQSAEVAELKFRLGRIRQQRLADMPGALDCYRGVLERVPRHPAAIAALEEISKTSGAGAVDAISVLEPIYEQEGEFAKLVDALEARAAAQVSPSARAALLRRVAEVRATSMRSPDLGFLAAARALREDPDQAETIKLAAKLAEVAGLEEELAALLGEVADRPREPAARVELRRRVAQLSARQADPSRAAQEWTRVLDLVPDDAEALVGLSDAWRAAGDIDGLTQVLRRRIGTEEDPAKRAPLLAELAQVQEERQRDFPGAIGTLRRLLELLPNQREALSRLDRLCVQTEKWAELADVLAREVASAQADGDAAAGVTFRQRLAELKETRLLDRDGALGLYEEILSVRPDDAQVLSRLEANLQRDPSNARTASVLERAYAATGAWSRYAAVLELRAGERPDPLERKALFVQLAEIHEQRLANPELAFVATCRAFRDDPADPAVRASMQRLAATTGHEEELAAIYEDEFERLSPAVAAEVAQTLGVLYEQKLADADFAIHWYERARRADPTTAADSLAALERLYRGAGRDVELADVLESSVALVSGAARSALLLRLGQLCENQLRDSVRACRAYESLVAEDPTQGAALRALEQIYESEGRLGDLALNLAAQRDLAADAATRLRLTARLATVSTALGKEEEAIELWSEVLGLEPRHEIALSSLEDLYEKMERWQELVELLRARLALTTDRREAARLNDKLGELLGAHLGDSSQAVSAYLAVLDADPRNRKALEALRDLYAAQGDLDGLASIYRRLVPLQPDAAGVKAIRLQLADVLLRAGKKGEAAEQGRRAFELEPHDEADLAKLAAVFEASGSAQDRVRAVEARAVLLSENGRDEEAVEAWLAAAGAWQKPLGKLDNAAAALEKVLELVPSHRDAWTRLKEIHAQFGNWRAYARVSDLFSRNLTDPVERIAVLKELGELHEKRLGQKDMAFITLCRAFQENPFDAEVVQAINRLAGDTNAWDELSAVYEQVAEDAKGQEKALLLLALGRLRDQRLDDPDEAEAAFRRALEVDPASPEALDALTDLFTRRGRLHDLVIALEQKLEAAAGLDEKKATLLEMARIYEGQLNDSGEAIQCLRRVLELDGADSNALDALASLYRRMKRWEDLASILARARDLAQDDATRIAYQLQVAAVYENDLGDDEAAVEAYRSVLGLDDRNHQSLSGLERLYTKLDRFAELNRIYERQVEGTEDPRERVRILGKSASIWEEKLGDSQRAIERYESILALDGENHAAVKSLEALYRKEMLWEKLIAVLQHHLALTQDRREMVNLDIQVGDVLWKELGQLDRAETMFRKALEIDSESREAVSALARLYERNGNWNQALEMLQREVRLTTSGNEAVDLQSRIGRIQEEMLGDRAAARGAFMKALDADPGHIPSIRALRAIAEAERDREAYLRYLLAEARYTKEDQEKAKLFHEAGRIHQEERDDADGATRFYEEALRRVPDFLPAVRPLADLYVARSDWARAEGTLDVMVKRLAQDGDTKELCRQSYRLGYVAEKLGKHNKALEAHRRAYELDATYLPALEGLGNLLVQDGAWEEALKIFQAIVIHHRDNLTDLEVVETHWQIGEILTKLGQGDRAAKSFQKALEIDAGHEPSRRSLIAVLDAAEEWEAAVAHREKLIQILPTAARLEVYLAVGTICRDRLQDPYQAIDAFTGAARIDPGNAQATEALLALYRDTHQGQKSADVLARMLESPEVKADPARAARLHYSLATTMRDELQDDAGAVQEFERALDADPRMVQAFGDLEALLTNGQKWRDLEQAYVRMIQRLPKGPDASAARVALWKTLGELYRRVLDDVEGARMAYEVVAKTDPDDLAAIEAHAELAAKLKGHEAEAIRSYRRFIALGGAPSKAVSPLVRLDAELKDYDATYSAAQTLAFLVGAATPEEGQVVSRLRRLARDTANGSLDDELWDKIFHERMRTPLASILALLAVEGSGVFLQEPKDVGLNPKKDEIDVGGSMLFFVNMYKYVARALGLPVPRLFKGGSGPHLVALPFHPRALLAGSELFQERPKKELWFTIGKAMAFLRPELTVVRLMPRDQLDVLFQAAVSLGTSRFVVTADPHLVQKLKHRLEKVLPEAIRAKKLKLLARAYCDVQQPGDLRTYLDAAEMTSNRVGALLAADLDVVRKMVLAEKAAVSKLKGDQRIRDLVTFCTSEEYGLLRQRLGLSVVVGGS